MSTAPDQENLIHEHISFRPSRPDPDDALAGYEAVPIWVVIDFARSVDFDAAQVAQMYGLTPDEVQAAFAYYQCHQPLIDARITVMTAPFR